MNGGSRTLHIGDIDTEMKDDEIIGILKGLNGNGLRKPYFVTHDEKLAKRTAKKYGTLYIQKPIPADEIVTCLETKKDLLRSTSIFCYSASTRIKCKNCQS